MDAIRQAVIMGAAQSKLPEPLVEERLTERLHALKVKESGFEAEQDYVYVNDQKMPEIMYSPTVSINIAEQWEKELMEDPKVTPSHVSGDLYSAKLICL